MLAPESVTAVLIDDDGSTALDSQRNALIESAEQDLLRHRQAPGAFDNLSRLSDRRDQSRIEIVSGGDIQFQGGCWRWPRRADRGHGAAARLRGAGRRAGRGRRGGRADRDGVQQRQDQRAGQRAARRANNRDAAKLFNGELWVTGAA